jgi:uncharacterized protein (PEP-CTERM system associated)
MGRARADLRRDLLAPVVLAAALLGATGSASAQSFGLPGLPGSQLPMGTGSLGRPQPGATDRGPPTQIQYGVRSTVLAADGSQSSASGASDSTSRQTLEVSPYVNASWRSATTQASLFWQLRSLQSHSDGQSDFSVRQDLRANLNSLLVGDWLGVQAGAAIFNTNATLAGVQSIDPASSVSNSAALRTAFVSPYAQGRLGALADWRLRYRFDHADTSSNVSAALARGSHLLEATLAGGAMFSTWTWALTTSGQRRDFPGDISLTSASTILTGYFTPSSELRLGASLNYLYIERLANAGGETNGWGPGVSLDWTPSRRTVLRANVARQYFGNTGSLSIAHRSQRIALGLDLSRSVLQSNSAALLTFNPGAVFSAGGFSSALNPLFAQLNALGLLSSNEVVIGTPIVNDALVRNRGAVASIGWIAPRWSASATLLRSQRETLVSSTVFGVPNALSSPAFGQFDSTGLTASASLALSERHTLGVTGLVRNSEQTDTGLKVRLSFVQATLSARLDARTTASIGVRRTVQSADGPSAVASDENALFGTLDFRMR